MAEIYWPCFVGTYEVRRASELPDEVRRASRLRQPSRNSDLTDPKDLKDLEDQIERDLSVPHLVQVGPSRREVPKREVWDMAVLRLLRTALPNISSVSGKKSLELQAERNRLGLAPDSDAYFKLWDKKIKETKAKPADYTDIEKSALAISSYLGFLTGRLDLWTKRVGDDLPHESLERWVRYADEIQAMFFGREASAGLPKHLVSVVGSLEIVLAYKPEGVSMHLRPGHTGDALIYHAAQMVTNGTKLENCEYCHSPFLSGGETRHSGKRRSDARFCGDECRWKHHNEMRSKAKRKKKL